MILLFSKYQSDTLRIWKIGKRLYYALSPRPMLNPFSFLSLSIRDVYGA